MLTASQVSTYLPTPRRFSSALSAQESFISCQLCRNRIYDIRRQATLTLQPQHEPPAKAMATMAPIGWIPFIQRKEPLADALIYVSTAGFSQKLIINYFIYSYYTLHVCAITIPISSTDRPWWSRWTQRTSSAAALQQIASQCIEQQ